MRKQKREQKELKTRPQKPHPVDEAGSIVIFVTNDMSEEKKTVKMQARQQQQMRLRRFQKKKKTWKSEGSLRKEGSTPKEEKQRLKEVSKCRKNIRDKKKNEKTARHPKNT